MKYIFVYLLALFLLIPCLYAVVRVIVTATKQINRTESVKRLKRLKVPWTRFLNAKGENND